MVTVMPWPLAHVHFKMKRAVTNPWPLLHHENPHTFKRRF
jgi:hypothetical protein